MTITPAPPAELHQKMTLEEWLGKISTLKQATRELVRLWFVNGFGSQRELARHLGMSTGTIGGHLKSLRASQEVTEEHYPFVAYNSRKKRSVSERSVENNVIEVEVISKEPETDMKLETVESYFDTTTNNNPKQKTNGRHQPELSDNSGLLPRQQPDGGGGGDFDNTLAQHWEDVQNSNEPDSYKQAQYFLSQFELQLSKGFRDRWSQSAYETLWRDLSSYTKSCGACSREYREQLDERTEEARSRIENPVPGSEDLREESGS